ncbi:MAG TPA: response regulator [Candidatus Kapabacteria bacterium]|nr:response regulator [Candidatus Kapabacteria bacterium]
MSIFNNKLQGRQENQGNENKQTIMIVDDEKCQLHAMESLLSGDYHIITASCGREALDIITGMKNPEIIGIIISDQRMPGLTGVELLLKLKDILPNAIRLILTGYDTDVDAEAAKAAKIFQIISKPFDINGLQNTIKLAIEEFERWKQKN